MRKVKLLMDYTQGTGPKHTAGSIVEVADAAYDFLLAVGGAEAVDEVDVDDFDTFAEAAEGEEVEETKPVFKLGKRKRSK